MISSLSLFSKFTIYKHGLQRPLSTSEIPTTFHSACHHVGHRYGLVTNNTGIIDVFNPYRVSKEKMSNTLIDIAYTSIKNKQIQQNIDLNMEDFPVGIKQIVRLTFDPTRSIYFSEGVYYNDIIKLRLKMLERHFCLFERLENGKIRVSNLTHSPTDISKFTYISNIDLIGKQKPQFLSNCSIDLDENIISSIDVLERDDSYVHTYNSLINNNYETTTISEESIFHLIKNKKYDPNLFPQLKEELNLNIDDAMEVFTQLIY